MYFASGIPCGKNVDIQNVLNENIVQNELKDRVCSASLAF